MFCCLNIVDTYEKTPPDVVILDGINALPQSREAAASIYRIFHTPTIAIGEEQIAGSHFAYIADTLLEVSQVFHRGARYRKIRVVKTRLGPSPGAEFYFTISKRGVRILQKWSQSHLGKEVTASSSGKRVVFAEDVESLVRAALRRNRPGVRAGSRVGVFLCEHPICLRISAAYLCDYMDNAKVGVLSTYPYIGTAAAHMGCGVNEEVVPASALGEDLALEEALERIGDAAVVFLYGLEEVLHMYGLERVSYVLDFIHSVLPDSALIATFRGVEPVSELLHIFNTVWQYFPDRAVVVKSAFGWPVRELKIRDEGGRLVFTLT